MKNYFYFHIVIFLLSATIISCKKEEYTPGKIYKLKKANFGLSSWEFIYDQDLILKITKYSGDYPFFTYNFEYDENKNLLRIHLSKAPDREIYEILNFDNKGRISKINSYDAKYKNDSSIVYYNYDGKNNIIKSVYGLGLYDRFEYDSSSNYIKQFFFDNRNEYLSTKVLNYDNKINPWSLLNLNNYLLDFYPYSKNNELEVEEYLRGIKQTVSTFKYEYNDQNLPVKKTQTVQNLIDKQTYSYITVFEYGY